MAYEFLVNYNSNCLQMSSVIRNVYSTYSNKMLERQLAYRKYNKIGGHVMIAIILVKW